jgi:hypothetical protein
VSDARALGLGTYSGTTRTSSSRSSSALALSASAARAPTTLAIGVSVSARLRVRPTKIFGWRVLFIFSPSKPSSSKSFSPGRTPVYSMSMSDAGVEARSGESGPAPGPTILTGLPMSRTKISPPAAEGAGLQHSWHASGMVMK